DPVPARRVVGDMAPEALLERGDGIAGVGERSKPAIIQDWREQFVDDGVSERLLAVEMVKERAFRGPCFGDDLIEAGRLEAASVDLAECGDEYPLASGLGVGTWFRHSPTYRPFGMFVNSTTRLLMKTP